MKKRFFGLFAALTLALPVFAQNVRDFTVRANMIDGVNGITIVGYFGTEKNIVIPSIIDGIPVTAIGEQAFMLRSLTNVKIPNGIIIIGRQAFFGNQLRNVYIPPSVRTIGEAAFDNNQYISLDRLHSNKTRIIEVAPVKRRETVVVVPTQLVERVGNIRIIEKVPAYTKKVETSNPREIVIIEKKDNEMREMVFVEKSSQTQVQTPPSAVVSVKECEPVFYDDKPIRISALEQWPTVKPAAEKPDPESSRGIDSRKPASNSKQVVVRATDIGPVTPPSAQLVPQPPSGPPVDEGTFVLQPNNDGTAAIVGYRGQYSFISIPTHIGNYKITSIANSALYQHRLLRVFIPDSITYIADGAFSGNSISEITFPESVRYIGYQAFSGNDLSRITIGSSVNIQADSIRGRFAEFYNLHGQLGGTYILHEGQWSYTNMDDVRYYTDR
jgi:hypothetical protein